MATAVVLYYNRNANHLKDLYFLLLIGHVMEIYSDNRLSIGGIIIIPKIQWL